MSKFLRYLTHSVVFALFGAIFAILASIPTILILTQ